MFKPSAKTVTLFIEHYDAYVDRMKRFVECTTVGSANKYKNPQEFIIEFQKMYTKFNNESESGSFFNITNVVIE